MKIIRKKKAEEKNDKPMEVQSLVFDREKFDKDEAVAWALDHDFTAEKVDESDPKTWRIRQHDPEMFEPESFRTVNLTDGVDAIMGKMIEKMDDEMASAPSGTWELAGDLSRSMWAMEPSRIAGAIRGIASAVSGIGDVDEIHSPRSMMMIVGDTAHIPISGVILKNVPQCLCGIGTTTSTLDVEAQLQSAMANDEIKTVVFEIDSPGGTMAGVDQLAGAIRAARATKKMVANVSDMCASAAYWIAAQCGEIRANKTAEVGSIGVYSVLVDTSEMASRHGVKVRVIKSGDAKGVGVDGAPITKEQIAIEQEQIDKACEMFCAAIAMGRGMDAKKVKALATGRLWFAGEAMEMGLIDAMPDEPGSIVGKKHKEKKKMEITDDDPGLMARVKEENAALAAKLAAQETALAEMRTALEVAKLAQREALISKYRDRISPAMEPHVRAYAEHCASPVDFESYLSVLPVQTRPDQIGNAGLAAGSEDLPDADDIESARRVGMSPKQYRAYASLKSVSTDGYVTTHEGKRIALKDLEG